jgi:hypothetical protein
MTPPDQPRYVHDCGPEYGCQFIGHKDEYDIWVHIRDHGIEVLARFGDGGPDYLSRTLLLVAT